AGVSVSTAGRIGAGAVGLVPLVADPVAVTSNGLNVRVSVRLEMLSRLPLEASSLDDVEQVRDDAAGQEGVAVVVKVDTPRVARAPGEDLELLLDRMIAPDAGVDRSALLLRRAGLADERVSEDAMTAVEPAIGAPDEGVERFVGV